MPAMRRALESACGERYGPAARSCRPVGGAGDRSFIPGGPGEVPGAPHAARHALPPHRPKAQVAPLRGRSSGTPTARTERRGNAPALPRGRLAAAAVLAAATALTATPTQARGGPRALGLENCTATACHFDVAPGTYDVRVQAPAGGRGERERQR